MRARAPLLFATLALGCTRPVLEVPAGERFIVATRAAGAREARWWSPEERELEVPSDAELAIAGPYPSAIPRWPDGAGIDPKEAALSFEPTPPAGSCGGCQLAPFGAVVPGDRCKIPAELRGAAYTLDGATLSSTPEAGRILEDLRLDWPGNCAWPALPESPGRIVARYLGPNPGRPPISSVAVAEDGVTVVSEPTHLTLLPVGAPPRELVQETTDPTVIAIPGAVPARFLVAGPGRDLSELSEATPTPILRQRDLTHPRAARLASGTLVLVGREPSLTSGDATAYRCELEPWRCTEELLPPACTGMVEWVEARGEIAWALARPWFLVIRDAAGTWSCGTQLPPDGLPTYYVGKSVARISPSRLLLCADDETTTRVYLLEVAQDGLSARTIDQLQLDRLVDCAQRIPEAGGARIVDRALSVRVRGDELSTDEPALLQGRTLHKLSATRTSTAYVTADGAVLRELGAGAELVLGPTAPASVEASAVSATDDGFWVIDGGAAERRDADGELVERRSAVGLEAGERIVLLARRPGGHWATSAGPSGSALLELDEDLAVSARRPLDLTELTDLADGGHGWVFALSRRGLFALSPEGGAPREVHGPGLRVLSAAGPTIWAVGESVVVRAMIVADAPRAEVIELERLYPPGEDTSRVREGPLLGISVHARSPGEARVMLVEHTTGGSDELYGVTRLLLESAEDGGWRVTRTYVGSGGRSRQYRRFAATEVLSIADDGSTYRDAKSAAQLFVGFRRAAVLAGDPWSRVLMSDDHGYLTLVRLE